MANYTIELYKLQPNIFDFDYELYDNNLKPHFEKFVLDYFYFNEIGFETVGRFKKALQNKLNVIAYKYKEYYKTVLEGNKPGTVGAPLPGTQFRIVDPDTMEELSVGEDGLILIGGAQIMKGYLKDPERTSQAIVVINGKRWYKTGDKGHVDEDGYLTIVDRYSRFAKLGGEMVSLGSVDFKISECSLFDEIDHFAVAVPDGSKGEKIVLVFAGERQW